MADTETPLHPLTPFQRGMLMLATIAISCLIQGDAPQAAAMIDTRR